MFWPRFAYPSAVASLPDGIGTGLQCAYWCVTGQMPLDQRGKKPVVEILNNKNANWFTVILNLIIEYALPCFEYIVWILHIPFNINFIKL